MASDTPAPVDVVILGGGAAGLMCAIEAGSRGKRVMLLEHGERVGRKIEISGGGRCNFTNLGATPENYLSQNPDFCRFAFARYAPRDFIALVQQHRIRYHEKTLGQQFCDGSSREIIQMLLAECRRARVEIRCGVRVNEVEKVDRFRLATSEGAIECSALVIATGGLSFQKLGATDFGYRLAKKFGVRVTAVRPGLVPLTFSEPQRSFAALSGVSLPVMAKAGGAAFREAMLVTHRGFSGPAILQISNYWREGDEIELDLTPDTNARDWLHRARGSRKQIANVLSERMPQRFAAQWSGLEAPRKTLAELSGAERVELASKINAWRIRPSGTDGYAKAEVTLGGVDTTELSSKTMECRKVPGLHFIGEVVDVTGWLGGYNFQWAWASGHAAGTSI
jgi:predicted Rossmann fold flavoprotein